MASRASSVSSLSDASSLEGRAVESGGFRDRRTGTGPTLDGGQTNDGQTGANEGAAAHQVNETVTAEPLLSHAESGQQDEHVAEYERKDPIQSHPMQYGKRSWYYDWWFWEVSGALLSLGSTVALVVLLAVCDNQPMPVLGHGITLNAMLSVLSTVAKTSMLLAATESISQAKWLLFRKQSRNLADFKTIDEASRGPWGAFQLLYRFWDGRTILASAGAFIVLASLAVDPFTQQILSYPSISNVTSGYQQPSFPRVTTWNTSGKLTDWESADSDPTSSVPLALRAAIYNSLLGLGTANSTLNINCPTGNCTFDQSDTLGFCSTCSDVTALATKKCSKIPTTLTTSGTNCTYTLPGNINLKALDEQVPDDYGSAEAESPQYRRTTNMSVVPLQRYQTLWSNDPEVVTSFEDPGRTVPSPKKTVFQGVSDPILAFGHIIFNSSTDPLSTIGNDIMPSATECALHWCVQTLSTSIQNGILNQTTIRTWTNDSALDTSDVHFSPYPAGSALAARTYYVSPAANVPLARFLQDAFNATVRATNIPGGQFTPQELLDLTIYSSDIAQALWYAEDLSLLMSNLADRMTDALRNLYSDPPSSPEDLGQVLTTRTYVHVSWPWLILPVGLVLASCGVLLAAIISSGRHGSIVWKSSSLAVLFHGLAGGIGEAKDGVDGNRDGGDAHSVYRRQMERTAEDMQVKLAETRDGDLRLVEMRGGEAARGRRWTGRRQVRG